MNSKREKQLETFAPSWPTELKETIEALPYEYEGFKPRIMETLAGF
jgi:hypothetical protein